MAPAKIIIDTDPGIDDVLALLLALSSKAEEIQVLMISLTFGNIDVKNCLRNTVSMFHVVEREMEWRRQHGLPEGFESLKAHRPLIAVGAERTLDEQTLLADYFHGKDGLGDVHTSHSHLIPTHPYEALFDANSEASVEELEEAARHHSSFIASRKPAHREVLRLLRENEPDSVVIVAVGPLTNLALAAAEDPETFLRAKEVVVMGGVVDGPGNMSPVAEFNTFADAMAAARVFALTSPEPQVTMPTAPASIPLPNYPAKLSRQLKLRLAPLDVTRLHNVTRGQYRGRSASVLSSGSPLGEFVSAILSHAFDKLDSLHHGHEGDKAELTLHDPVCVWYALTESTGLWKFQTTDIRVETRGQWTRGMCVVDRRNRKKAEVDGVNDDDPDQWLGKSGNRIDVIVETPGGEKLAPFLFDRIFGGRVIDCLAP
ncbi:hypothetical protein VTO42DRAFT_1469 [Malbranchea cinnamomea]